MSIVDTPEKCLFNVDQKSDMRKLGMSSEISSSALFSCSVRSMYNRVNSAKKNVSCLSHIFQA